ncbi:MAG: hypothetical protein ACD_4C00246G0001 [uncultured bacterium (gcode 4)]|uniref:Uncharacterized protein n=1 Tax=uncultured bacterium (gcode 4) TaxID=1234023 RepID=K2G8U1_9BACT|nr:MAG: hypothetical protein ACD_4C00246G0001 [uncultured bacterium (gcode 4)]
MLNIEIKKWKIPLLNEKNFVTTKKINIDFWLEAIIQLNYSDKNFLSLIENIIIDILLWNSWSEVYSNFSLSLEKINKEIKKLSSDYNLSNLNVFVWIIEKETLHFSILGNYSIYLIKNNKIINIADWMQWKNLEFSYISSWNIWQFDNVYISNIEILNYITKDDILEISLIDDSEKKLELIEKIISQEDITEQYDMIVLNCKKDIIAFQKNSFETIKNQFLNIKDKLWENKQVQIAIEKIKSRIDLNNKYVKITFFSVWVLVSISLLYLIISQILIQNVKSSIPAEYKNKLIEAQMIIEKTTKDLWNKEVFTNNIKKAEELIFQVREQNIFLNDVKKLLDHISSLKKQLNWIESFALTKDKSQVEFDSSFSVNWIFELNKKYYFVWKNSIIWPYIKWEQIKKYDYPDWEEAISADLSPDWYIYILTKTYRILMFNKQEYKYINVEWQKTWENAKSIKTFNSNLYLLSDEWNQILRHKPGVNGFSSKFWIIDDNDTKNLKIYDFAIDGWFYMLKNDLTIDKIITAPTYFKRSIVINWLPKNYTNDGVNEPKIFTGLNLNYIYVLLNNSIWIFEADSKNYKDVKAIKYIGQLEPVESKINTIYIPKDWTILVWNNKWVYTINFEISDWKVVVR